MDKIICISRQYASGGHEIGIRLAQKYKIPLYDKELLLESMRTSGFSKELIESHDENAHDSLMYSIAMGQFSRTGTKFVVPPGDLVFQTQAQVIRNLKTPCIIIGRCAGEILRTSSNVVRIFIYANNEFRCNRAIQFYGCEQDAVAGIIRKKDKQRAEYFNRYTKCKWESIESFDLAIDSSQCGIDCAVNTIINYLDQRN